MKKNNEFEEFTELLNNYNLDSDGQFTSEEMEFVGSVYSSAKEFLTENQLVSGESLPAVESFDTPITSLASEVTLNDIGIDPLFDLCKKAQIPDNRLKGTISKLALTLNNYSNGVIKNTHFDSSTGLESFDSNVNVKTFDTMFSSKGFASNTLSIESAWKTASESFGMTTDNTYLDAKLAITVVLLEAHKSILSRFLPTKPVDGELVTFTVDRNEIYDIAKASADTGAERYKGDHRTPFIDLYTNPEPADTTPKKIIPLTANDGGGDYLIADGIVKINKEANLFDLSLLPSVIGMDKIDYTDIISEGGKVDTVVMKVTDTDTSTSELFEIPVSNLSGSRFTYPTNAVESSERIANVEGIAAADENTVLLSGTSSSVLAFLNDDNHFVKLTYTLNGKLDIRTSYTRCTAALEVELTTKDETAPIAAMVTAFEFLEFEIVGYKPAVYFSPENIRRISAAARLMTSLIAYPIPGSKTIAVDYSVVQSTPEKVINLLTDYLKIGDDTRGINLVLDNLNYVKSRLDQENEYLFTGNYTEKVMTEFVAGYKVKPSVITDTYSVATNTTSIKSSDIWGDVRTEFEKYLVEVVTKLMNTSLYYTQLNPGEKVTFNILTSGYIKDALFSVPFYHTGLENGTQKDPDGQTEFRRILPNGTVLNVITTNFDYMSDKILMVPVRPTAPNSELNYATVADKGNYVATLSAYSGASSAFKRVIANSRKIPIVTCPVGAFISVANLSSVFDGIGGLGV